MASRTKETETVVQVNSEHLVGRLTEGINLLIFAMSNYVSALAI
jgi:hypothetical protein